MADEILRVDQDSAAAHLESEETLDLLAISPQADDLSEVFAARPARRKLPTVTLALVAGVLLAGGFIGGVQVQKWQTPSTTTGRTGAFTGTGAAGTGAARTGRGGFGGFGGAGGAGGAGGTGGSVVGTVKLVDGDNVYVQDTSGNITKVSTSSTTTVSVSKPGTVSQLTPGSTVIVVGSPGADGTVAARSITAR